MQRRVEVLRFKAGQRTVAPPPELFWERAPDGVPPEAGEELVILVDLNPYIPHRAREMRTLAEETFWTATGSITARMRRAIAEANRYLVRHNAEVHADLRTYGSLTLIAFSQEEAFIGQAGPGNTLIHYPQQRLMELFPKPGRNLTPIGVAVPPVIHISYATLEPGCQVVSLTSSIMQTQLIPAWERLLAEQAAAPERPIFADELTKKQVTGGAVHVFCLEDEEEPPQRSPTRKKFHLPRVWGRTDSAAAAKATAAHPVIQPDHARPQPPVTEEPAPEAEKRPGLKPLIAGAAIAAGFWARLRRPTPVEESAPAEDTGIPGSTDIPSAAGSADVSSATGKADVPSTAGKADVPSTAGKADVPSTAGKADVSSATGKADVSSAPAEEGTESLPIGGAGRPRQRKRTPDKSAYGATRRLAHFIQTFTHSLLPGKTRARRMRVPSRPVPPEQRWFPGLALALALLAFFTVGIVYAEMGGAQRARLLLSEAQKARTLAYEQQSPESWRKVQSLAQTVLILDADNAEARALQEEAQLALDALQKAALLAIQPLRELGVSPQPRRLIATQRTLYLLNPVTDEVLALDVREPDAARSLLKHGQSLNGIVVPHLVDIAWIPPTPGYRDGALLIYGDGGYLYVYEPALGPDEITLHRLSGELPAGAVTMIGTLCTRLYLVQARSNQLLIYQPVNGVYSAPPRFYFPPNLTPALQTVLGLALDGRVYLLFGDGSLRAYYEGVEDPSFTVTGLQEVDFKASLLALDADPNGAVFLADKKLELIVMLDRKGAAHHHFRLPGHLGRSLECLAPAPDGKTLYLVAENKLYAAPLPEFARP